MKAIGVIPSRFGATRFPGKPLKPILGRPMVEWVIEGALKAKRLSEIWVATDHEEIAAVARKMGVRAVMTPSECPTGSDRVYYAVREAQVDVVLNIQGDEPLINGEMLDQLAEPLLKDPTLNMATLGRTLKAGDLENRATAKVVLNRHHDAIYFSRLGIPYTRVDAPANGGVSLKHIGLYAFRKSFLAEFCAQPPTPLELAEGLEQLRALYLGERIRVVHVEHEAIGVDTPEDVAKAEALLKRR